MGESRRNTTDWDHETGIEAADRWHLEAMERRARRGVMGPTVHEMTVGVITTYLAHAAPADRPPEEWCDWPMCSGPTCSVCWRQSLPRSEDHGTKGCDVIHSAPHGWGHEAGIEAARLEAARTAYQDAPGSWTWEQAFEAAVDAYLTHVPARLTQREEAD